MASGPNTDVTVDTTLKHQAFYLKPAPMWINNGHSVEKGADYVVVMKLASAKSLPATRNRHPPKKKAKTMTDRNSSINQPFGLMDGASGEFQHIQQEVNRQRKITADLSRPLSERLEAYEDIIDSEVGDTAFIRARNIERETGLRQIFLKFEGGNPTGTQKDRVAFAQAMDALRRRFDAITVATCGNFGVAQALAASLAGIRCIIYIPGNYHTRRIREMEALGAEIVRVPGDYEGAVKASSEQAEKMEWYDANPGGSNTAMQMGAYGGISYEIYDELGDAPAAVAAPVSNGTTFAGVFKGFASLYRRGKTSRLPRMVAGSSFRKNPIVQAALKNKPNCEDLVPEKIRETRINEPLINWHAIDGNVALRAIRESSGWAGNASDRSMRQYSRLIREREGLDVLPASTAGLIALIENHKINPLPNDRYVVVLTGRKS
jgi:threonine synthase